MCCLGVQSVQEYEHNLWNRLIARCDDCGNIAVAVSVVAMSEVISDCLF